MNITVILVAGQTFNLIFQPLSYYDGKINLPFLFIFLMTSDIVSMKIQGHSGYTLNFIANFSFIISLMTFEVTMIFLC